ncbi:hypothetical protein [Flavobacterium sp. 3HN19-14]|uniref:hypothetical protein n=1 Tax=Flavobacterium sp. 3HN19-14 TaxID=3448133 RepID=UPI003EE0AE73
MSDIKLNFINNSNDANNSQIVIFQKNYAEDNLNPVAWKVIRECGARHEPSFYLRIFTDDLWQRRFRQLHTEATRGSNAGI